MYFFDNSATTPINEKVLNLIIKTQKDIYGNASSIHQLGRKSKSTIEKAREQVANAIGANPDQIIFTSGGTESNNQVLWSRLGKKKNHIISNTIEHPAILKVLEKLSSFGIKHNLVSVDEKGTVSIDEINAAISTYTGLISIMLGNNEVGTIQPIKKISQLCIEKEVLIHTDAVQCLGKIPIDVKDLGVDFLSLSAHKFYGPKGIGVLYIKNKNLVSPFLIGGHQESGLRAGTEDIASIAGLGLAAELVTSKIDDYMTKLNNLENKFKTGLISFFPQAIFNGNPDNKLPGLISVSFPGFRSDMLMAKLDRAAIAVSSGSACGSGDIKPSTILAEMGINNETNISTLRFSFGSTNSSKEINVLLNTLQLILN